METFGKSGCRRIVPGQYLAIDPKGRAVMIAAVEKQKLVYILNRDTQVNILQPSLHPFRHKAKNSKLRLNYSGDMNNRNILITNF